MNLNGKMSKIEKDEKFRKNKQDKSGTPDPDFDPDLYNFRLFWTFCGMALELFPRGFTTKAPKCNGHKDYPRPTYDPMLYAKPYSSVGLCSTVHFFLFSYNITPSRNVGNYVTFRWWCILFFSYCSIKIYILYFVERKFTKKKG